MRKKSILRGMSCEKMQLGGVLDRLGGVLGRLGAVLAASWRRLGADFGVLGRILGVKAGRGRPLKAAEGGHGGCAGGC